MICTRCGKDHDVVDGEGAFIQSPTYLGNQSVRYYIGRECWVPLLHYVTGYAVNEPNIMKEANVRKKKAQRHSLHVA